MYRAFLGLFEKKGDKDSIAKYARLYCEANDSSVAVKDQELTALMAATYNYSKIQKESFENEKKLLRRNVQIVIIIVSVILIAIAGFYFFRRYRQSLILRQKEAELKHKKEQEAKQKTLKAISKELSKKDDQNKELAKLNDSLREELKNANLNETLLTEMERYNKFADTVIFKKFTQASKIPTIKITENDWKLLTKVFGYYYPQILEDVSQLRSKKTELRLRICILTVMGMANKEQSSLLNETKQSITNNTAALNEALFGEKLSSTFYTKLKSRYKLI